jgi:hypothetical protein
VYILEKITKAFSRSVCWPKASCSWKSQNKPAAQHIPTLEIWIKLLEYVEFPAWEIGVMWDARQNENNSRLKVNTQNRMRRIGA